MMTRKFEILDCTIRDGGYYTDWDFDDSLIKTYMESMQYLPVDILEIGYRSKPQKGYLGKYFYFPDYAIQELGKMNSSKKLSLMLNEKDVRPNNLDFLLTGIAPYISLIRLAVDPNNFERAIALAKAIRNKGFEVGFNVMYMSKYSQDQAFLDKLKQLDGLVEYLNIVDSYGGMFPVQTRKLVEKVKLNCAVKIGFHGHNNLELAFANTLAAIDAGCEIVDATVLGMGRGAGNLKTELLLTYMASNGMAEFDFNQLAALIEAWTPLYEKHEWGTNLPYMVSGSNSLPQKDVMEWVTQRFYSINSIIRALQIQKAGEKDNLSLPIYQPEKSYKNVVIIGGGPNAVAHAEAVKQFIKKSDDICVIHASSKNTKSYQDLEVKQLFCLVGNEGHRLESVFNDLDNFTGKCILPPFPRKMGTYIPGLVKEEAYELKEVSFTDKFQDSHTALALQLSIELNAQKIYLVGYDGYKDGSISPREQGLISENEYSFSNIKDHMELCSLTPTQYSIPVSSVYSLIL
jgi:4-hydroxy 2-oxovalerate aldolase